MRVSVVIASYQRPQSLIRALRSLAAQTRPPDEVIVVTKTYDAVTRPAVEQFVARERPPYRVLNPEVDRHPVFYAENKGIETATGDIVVFMDDDVEAFPDCIARMEAHYVDPRIGGVGGRDIQYYDGQPYHKQTSVVGKVYWYGRTVGGHNLAADGIMFVDLLKGCNMSFHREALCKTDERILGNYHWEDDMCFSARKRGYLLLFDPDICVKHYIRNWVQHEQMKADREFAYAINHNRAYTMLKHLPWLRKLAFLVYFFLIGDSWFWGLVWVLRGVVLRRYPLSELLGRFLIVLRGKLAGCRTYLRATFRSERAKVATDSP